MPQHTQTLKIQLSKRKKSQWTNAVELLSCWILCQSQEREQLQDEGVEMTYCFMTTDFQF